MDVAAALEPYGWALNSGDYGGVGVGGLATAGGIGWLSSRIWPTIDHLCAVEIRASQTVRWCMQITRKTRISSGRFVALDELGIVTSFEFEVDEVGSVGWGQLVFNASNTADFLEKGARP